MAEPNHSGGPQTIAVTLPRVLPDSAPSATVLKWLKRPGERVEANEPLVSVTCGSRAQAVTWPVAGHLSQILVSEGQTVFGGSKLATLSVSQASTRTTATASNVTDTPPLGPQQPSNPPAGAPEGPPPPPGGQSARPRAKRGKHYTSPVFAFIGFLILVIPPLREHYDLAILWCLQHFVGFLHIQNATLLFYLPLIALLAGMWIHEQAMEEEND